MNTDYTFAVCPSASLADIQEWMDDMFDGEEGDTYARFPEDDTTLYIFTRPADALLFKIKWHESVTLIGVPDAA